MTGGRGPVQAGVAGSRALAVARLRGRVLADRRNPSDDVGVRRSVLLGTVGTLVLNVVTVVIGFALALVLARTLGTSGYGAYAFAFAWATFLSVPASLGIGPLVVRHVASYAEREQWGLLRGVVRRTNQVVGATSAAIVVVAALVGLAFRDSRPELVGPFLIGLLLVPVVALTTLRQAAMQGLHRVVLGRLPDTVVLPVVFLALVLVCAGVLGDSFTASWAIALNVAAGAVALTLGIVLLRRSLPPQVRRSVPEYEHRDWVRSGVPLLILGLLLVINTQVGTILLGALDDADAAGVFSVAMRAATFTSFLFLAASYPLYPNVARLWTTGDRAAIQSLLTRTSRIVSLFSVCVAVGFFVFGHALLGIFGAEFTAGVTALRILVLGELVKVLAGFGGLALVMTSEEASMTRGTAVGVVLNVVLAAALIPVWGVDGAAVASAVGALVAGVYVAWLTWRRLGLYAPAVGLAAFRAGARRAR